jgi:hypothetical protein
VPVVNLAANLHHADPRLRFAQRGIVFDVLPGAGGVEDEVDIGKLRQGWAA